MELLSDEMKHVTALVEEWTKNPEAELEATFGLQGIVDVQTFLNVVARLRSKGLKAIPQEDRLTVSLKDGVRFTIVGNNIVEDYCRDDTMANKDYIAIIKNRTATASTVPDTIDIPDYYLRIKSRRETNLAKNDKLVTDALVRWANIPKYFRIIRRWTFEDSRKGIRYDLSMVRSTPFGKMQRSFQEINFLNSPPVYELEVELERGNHDGKSVVDIRNVFLQGIGEVLRGIQGSPILIRKKDKLKVLQDYETLTGTKQFRGNRLVPLMKKNMITVQEDGVPNIRIGYNVTDKADGLRVLGFTNDEGHLYMIDMAMNVYNTGLANKLCRNSLVDGEYVTKDAKGKGIQLFLLFDIWYAADKEYIGDKPFKAERHPALEKWITDWTSAGNLTKVMNSTTLLVKMKRYYFPETDVPEGIFVNAKRILDTPATRNYYTDGLIFTPNDLPLPDKPDSTFREQFKWKPAMDNTVDFLVKIDKEPDMPTLDKITYGVHPGSGEEIRYKTLRLYVGSSQPADPRSIILNQIPFTSDKVRGKYRGVLFTPSEFPDTEASTCYLKVHEDPSTNELYVATEPIQHDAEVAAVAGTPIRDESIVEMRYDPARPQGWRWIPIRIRADKMERYMRGKKTGQIEGTLNSLLTANGVWESIHDPITEGMITTGAEIPTAKELEILQAAMPSAAITTKYYERKAQTHDLKKVDGLRSFHNLYIKEALLYGSVLHKPGKTLIDLTVGRAGDLGRWVRNKAGFVLGVDAAGINITDPQSGAYARLLSLKRQRYQQRSQEPIAPMFFIIGDSSKRLKTGEAGESAVEQNMLRSILGQEPQGDIPSLVLSSGAGALRNGADSIVCMYALHYFFESEAKFNGFLQNIADNLKIGGYFAGTNFDGQKVFELLKRARKAKGESYVGMDDGTPLWEITREYEEDELRKDNSGFGMAIDVEFISIGTKHREYLVPWELLVAKMKSIGCDLVPKDELKALGLRNSTNLYEESYQMATAGKDSKKYPMSDAVKEFSFLNRWYIFKRTSDGLADAGLAAAQEDLEVVAEEKAPEQQRAELAAAAAAVRTAASVDATMMPSILASNSLAAAEAAKKASTPTVEEPPAVAPAGPAAVPVPGAALAAAPANKKVYAANEIIRFSEKSPEKEAKLRLPSKYASYALRHLCPTALFPIRDTTDSSDTNLYPSIIHFLAGMLIKYGNPSKKDLAWTLFSTTGTIHTTAKLQRNAAKNPLPPAQLYDSFAQEANEVNRKLTEIINAPNSGIDLTLWNVKKNEMLSIAVQQRLTNDEWFRQIIDAARGKYLLYENASSLGGRFTSARKVEGENAYGKKIMELAGY